MGYIKWQPGDPVTINRIVWDEEEKKAIQDVLDRDWFGPGLYASKLEQALAEYIGVKHVQLVNSGTSALYLALQALKFRGDIKSGYLVHPACTFPSPANVILQSNMIPLFVDVEPYTYNIDAQAMANTLKERFSSGPISVMGAVIPHLIGNITDMDVLLEALDGLPLIEDCCDTLGSEWDEKRVGGFGIASAFSFYGSHHITTAGVGGAFATNDSELYDIVRSMTFWGKIKHDSNGDKYEDFTHRYTYSTIGYDMQMTEIQAAFGLAQLQKLDTLNQGRDAQFELTYRYFKKWEEYLGLPVSKPKARPSWFGFPLLVKENAPFDREQFARYLLRHKIEIRPMFAGNITKQPAYALVPYVKAGDLSESDRNMERAFFIPCWGAMCSEQTAYLFGVVEDFLSKW